MMKVIIYGAGGHGRVVHHVLTRTRQFRVEGFVDDGAAGPVAGLPVLGSAENLENLDVEGAVAAIGDNSLRTAKAGLLTSQSFRLITAVDPAAVVAPDAALGVGTVVMPGAVINPGAVIGNNVIINSGAVIEHDCRIGDGVHIAPGALLAGGVSVGELAHVGIGSAVIENITIGSRVTVAAGAVVTGAVADGLTVMGVPARPKGD